MWFARLPVLGTEGGIYGGGVVRGEGGVVEGRVVRGYTVDGNALKGYHA